MDLSLMMGLMPGQEHDCLADGSRFAAGSGDLALERFGGLIGSEFPDRFISRRELLADHGERGDIAVGRGGATTEIGDQFGVLGRSLEEALVQIGIMSRRA